MTGFKGHPFRISSHVKKRSRAFGRGMGLGFKAQGLGDPDKGLCTVRVV